MTGLDTVAELRRAGKKPSAVMIDMVERHTEHSLPIYRVSPKGMVQVEIAAADSLSDIDFRVLTGLRVQLYDHLTGNVARQRRAAKMIAAVNPALLFVAIADGDGWMTYTRRAGTPPTTESIRL
jgi:hypothetical protein